MQSINYNLVNAKKNCKCLRYLIEIVYRCYLVEAQAKVKIHGLLVVFNDMQIDSCAP